MRLIKKLALRAYVLLLMAVTVWYGFFMYPLIFGFEDKEGAAASLRELGLAGTEGEKLFVGLIADHSQQRRTDLGDRVIEQPYIQGHFHHIGFPIQQDKTSVCVGCHGSLPHHHTREVRSFLNMHAFFLACETCHIQLAGGFPRWSFRWYDKETGESVVTPPALLEIEDIHRQGLERVKYPTYGNYGAKIAPDTGDRGPSSTIYAAESVALARRYIEGNADFSQEQRSQLELIFHRMLSKQAVQCQQCHRQSEPYLPFAELGYPPRRIEDLTHAAVVGMVEKYQKFFLPGIVTSQEQPGAEN